MIDCPDGQILVRATINLAGDPYPLEPGDLVCVTPDDPHIARLIHATYLVAVEDWQPATA